MNQGMVLQKPGFHWDLPDGYVELLYFQLKVMNILVARAYKINDEERIP